MKMWSKEIEFELTEDHLKLMSRMDLEWDSCEFGAPAVDPKRPYGNSDVEHDIAEILGWEVDDEGLSDEQWDLTRKLHDETLYALSVVLSLRTFELGVYRKEAYSSEWVRVE
jgi:hypothetical protein